MKRLLNIIFVFSVFVNAQTTEEKLVKTMKEFHQALVKKDYEAIRKYTDDALSYGHSNGWVETKADVIHDLEAGILSYDSFREDSVKVTISNSTAHIRYVADIDATLRGNKSHHHLKVLEVWVKKEDKWLLFARQAVRG